jgi:alkylhydroperoxidase family enzyme
MTNDAWSTLTAPQALARYAPAANAALNDLIAATAAIPGHPALGGSIRALCGETISLPPLQPAVSAVANDDAERAALALTEQFCIDVSSVGDDLRGPFMQHFGASAFAAGLAIYLADFTPRVRRVLEQLFRADSAGWPLVDSDTTIEAQPAFMEFVRVIYNMRGLDPVLTELVRLRGARAHQCRICKSLRAESALAAGGNEAKYNAIDSYETSDFSAKQKAALALVDAIIWQPGHVPEAAIAAIRTHFTAAEAVELVLDIMRNSSQKNAVALGADAPFIDGVQRYDIDEEGNMHFGEAMVA